MHKFYKAQITAFGSPAIVITTAFQNAGGYYKGESFCVFPEPYPGRAFTEIKFDRKDYPGSPIDLSDEFMQNLNNKHNTRKIEKKNARDKL